MEDRNRNLLIGVAVILLIGVCAIQAHLSPIYNRIETAGMPVGARGHGASDVMVQLPGQFIVASFTGFREVVAGALWIRADDFFHRGQYQAIIPIVRIVTWLDPHNIDVYTTGAWHLDYNFVDEANQLSDKRYIPASVALLNEGIKNNPNIWDLYFEMGWTHYSKKLNDEQKALEYIEKACQHDGVDPNSGQRINRPEFVDRMLAHSYEKVGRFDDAIKQWHKSRAEVEKIINGYKRNKKNPIGFVDYTSLDVCDRNLALLQLRLGWRYADMKNYKEGLELAEKVSQPLIAQWEKSGRKYRLPEWVTYTRAARKDYESRVGKQWAGDAQKPLDAGFQVSWMRAAPKVILIKGKVNLCPASEYKGLASEAFTGWYKQNEAQNADRKQMWRDGSRVYWRLEDYDYKMPTLDSFNWKIDLSKTVAWDSIYVGGGAFSDRVDLSDPRDAEMYPFTAKKYKLTIWVDPIQPGVPDFVQDRIGWKGEALTDKNCLDLKTRPGFHMLKKEFILNRSDII